MDKKLILKTLDDIVTFREEPTQEQIEALIEAMDIVEEHSQIGGWIPCSERLPGDGVDVLVWYEYFRYGEYNRLFQTTGISFTYNGKWSGFVNGQSGWSQLRIIAWQPLPEAYHGQMGENMIELFETVLKALVCPFWLLIEEGVEEGVEDGQMD